MEGDLLGAVRNTATFRKCVVILLSAEGNGDVDACINAVRD